jgi:hypothetical protein
VAYKIFMPNLRHEERDLVLLSEHIFGALWQHNQFARLHLATAPKTPKPPTNLSMLFAWSQKGQMALRAYIYDQSF